MGIRLLPKVMTVYDHERHNGRSFVCILLPNSEASGDNMSKWLKINTHCLHQHVAQIIRFPAVCMYHRCTNAFYVFYSCHVISVFIVFEIIFPTFLNKSFT